MILPNSSSAQASGYKGPALEDVREWFMKVEIAAKKFTADRDLVLTLFWNTCKDVRLTGANIAVLFYYLRSQNLDNIRESELEYLLLGNGGVNGMRLRSSAFLRMFKTNEYVFTGCKYMIDGIRLKNLRLGKNPNQPFQK